MQPARSNKPKRPAQWLLLGVPIIGVLAAVAAVVGVLAYRTRAGSTDGVTIQQAAPVASSSLATPTVAASPLTGSQEAQTPAPNGPRVATDAPASAPPAPAGQPSPQAAGAVPTVERQASPAAASTGGAPAGDTAKLIVVNAAPDGVRLRSEPGDGEPLTVLADGTLLDGLGETREVAGRTWMLVREATGRQGWVAADFLAAIEPTATPTIVARTATATPASAPTATSRPQLPPPPAVVPTATTARVTSTPVATVVPTAAPATPQPPTAAPAAPLPTRGPAAPALPAVPPANAGAGSGTGRAAPRGSDCPSSHPIKGNHSSSGEWIYHPPRGQFYSRTIPEDCFATEADARAAGYRASMR